jgi:hypothetical protein
METSVFEQILSSLTVKSICNRLGPDVPAGTTIEDVVGIALNSVPDVDPNREFQSRVINADGNVVGVLWWQNDAELFTPALVVDEIMKSTKPDEFISSATTILDAVQIFGTKRNEFFYVIHVNEIIGILRYSDLFKPLARLAFFALAIEIEELALELCQTKSEPCWLSIPDGRRQKAVDQFKFRHKREPQAFSEFDELIQCTNLADKATMMWKQKLITPPIRADILGFFNSLRKIRDQCAHPGGDLYLLSTDSLARFLDAAKCMRSSLHNAIETYGAERGPPY